MTNTNEDVKRSSAQDRSQFDPREKHVMKTFMVPIRGGSMNRFGKIPRDQTDLYLHAVISGVLIRGYFQANSFFLN